ncbi:hypothetical protein Vretimale_18824 [Volvox reticuliferus]|nr:hypothetical protein Vretifemale_18882 [Volvox reticuliferus]GIM16173.1 hypothetical protein Vretimale_18824 [Volvox reticuliferus]
MLEVGGLRLLASPWSPEYAGVWQLPDEAAGQQHWSRLLPSELEIDVLVTHTPPYGYGDLTRGRHVGDKQLLVAVQRMERPPRLWICGHIHEAAGEYRVPHPAVPGAGILLINAASFYAAAKKGYERQAQPRAVSLPDVRVVAQGDPDNLAAAAAAARGGGSGGGGGGVGNGSGLKPGVRPPTVANGEVWSAPHDRIRL